jgi:hypothetical protein
MKRAYRRAIARRVCFAIALLAYPVFYLHTPTQRLPSIEKAISQLDIFMLN